MRDRRNTNLSTSSTSSSSSSTTSGDSPTEKTKLPSFEDLPSPATKENARKRRRTRKVALKVFGVVFCLLLLLRCVPPTLPLIGLLPSSAVPSNHPFVADRYSGDTLPDEPKAMMVIDAAGRSRWTVSIPPSHSFPLRGQQYQDICNQGEVLRYTIEESSPFQRAKSVAKWRGSYAKDPTFIDVGDAQTQGLLPKYPPTSVDQNVCERSLTFSMATDDAGFGKTLLMLWMSYGLAKKEGRAFFLDDTDWPYGSYTTFFQPPPKQSCAPPPPSHILPCPHIADHLVVSASTAPYTFDKAFHANFQNPRKHSVAKNKAIYDLARSGYEALFHLQDEDAAYATNRIAEIRSQAEATNQPVIGMHIRRGDLHPLEVQFSSDYLPLERYTDAARTLYQQVSQHKTPGPPADQNVPLLLATDDPELFTSADLLDQLSPFKPNSNPSNRPNPSTPHPLNFALTRPQTRIQLATKRTLDASSPRPPIREKGSAYTKHVDENSGWEGGFYSALLFSAGGKPLESQYGSKGKGAGGNVVGEQAMRMRELVGRGYLLDLAVLGQVATTDESGAGGGVVCAVSSAGCRILGVMGGWVAVASGGEGWGGFGFGFGGGSGSGNAVGWVNVDDGRVWSWDGSR